MVTAWNEDHQRRCQAAGKAAQLLQSACSKAVHEIWPLKLDFWGKSKGKPGWSGWCLLLKNLENLWQGIPRLNRQLWFRYATYLCYSPLMAPHPANTLLNRKPTEIVWPFGLFKGICTDPNPAILPWAILNLRQEAESPHDTPDPRCRSAALRNSEAAFLRMQQDHILLTTKDAHGASPTVIGNQGTHCPAIWFAKSY